MSRRRKSGNEPPDHPSTIRGLPPGMEKMGLAEQLLLLSQVGHDALRKLADEERAKLDSARGDEPSSKGPPGESPKEPPAKRPKRRKARGADREPPASS
jgi:hypothetical protein